MSDDINNGLLLNNQHYIPPEILTLILSNVDVTTLYKYCTLVCKRWNAIIKESVWKLKCEQEFMKGNEHKDKLQLLRQKQYPYNVYQTISVLKNSFYTNLIKNPCGMEGLKYWKVDQDIANFISIEDCTLYDNNICEINDEMIFSVLNNITKCFTTSYEAPVSKMQIIDLFKETGLTQRFIDEYQPPIYISEWYGSRWVGVRCLYKLWVKLLDADYKTIERCNCNYLFDCQVDQRRFGSFQKVQHVFKNYGKNIRYVFFCHMGMEFNVQRKHTGVKFTNANVQLFYPNDTHLDHVMEMDALTPQQESCHELCREYCKLTDMDKLY